DVQKEIPYLAWHSQTDPSWDDAQWKVSFEHADLDITLKMIPALWVSGKLGFPSHGDDAPASLSQQIRNSNLPSSHSETDNIPQGQGCQWITWHSL
ncbi:hypothetical protein A4X09_0g6529, partial [Tilletia walkeri]